MGESDELYCLPAGRLGVDYAERLRLVTPEAWYRQGSNPLHRLIDLAAGSSLAPAVILLDARTGISPISAPLLFDVSDLAVICFFPHPQAERGTELLVESLLSARTRRSTEAQVIAPEPRFLISPVPPGPSSDRVRDRALSWVDGWLDKPHGRRSVDLGLRADELTHTVFYSPETAFRDRVELNPSCQETYGPVADWLEQLLPSSTTIGGEASASRADAIAQLDFAAGIAEDQAELRDDFVRTSIATQAMEWNRPLVLGRKGTGKTAIFRLLLEGDGPHPAVPVAGPRKYLGKYPWLLSRSGFAEVDRHLAGRKFGWSAFWACYCALAASLGLPGGRVVDPPETFSPALSELVQMAASGGMDEGGVVDALARMLALPDAELLAVRWLKKLDERTDRGHFLLFDGLDTGFGSDDEGRDLRARAVIGLFDFFTDVESRLDRLAFKVLLRADIWRQLTFQNKSHLLGRQVTLQWRDQSDYFKTVLKQAVRSPAFKATLGSAGLGVEPDSWDAAEVVLAWNLLVGERMKGAKTTFTRNWVWNRLADGLGDHSPRTLFQLFDAAVTWERNEANRGGYDRSVIRPRALAPSLQGTSVTATDALREEFPELASLMTALERIGRTPFEPADLEQIDRSLGGLLDLGLEVGLVAIHEGTKQEPVRYRVPDLYRYALDISRKGQA